MRLSPPKNVTWFVALALLVIGLLGSAGLIGALGTYAFFLVAASAVLLLVATLVKGL